MRILIVSLNYAPEPIGIGPYTTGLAEWLSARGHEVEVLAGRPYYRSGGHIRASALPTGGARVRMVSASSAAHITSRAGRTEPSACSTT